MMQDSTIPTSRPAENPGDDSRDWEKRPEILRVIIRAAYDMEYKSLGERGDVISRFTAALPGIVFQKPSDPDSAVPAELEALFKTDTFVIHFQTEDGLILERFEAVVHGEGNPLPALAALCTPNQWSLVHWSSEAIIHLPEEDSPECEQFQKWRDQAVSGLSAPRDPHSPS